ncbi:MAG TPA: SDR family NAD(P)-dependent oxidoreductase [bacterium]|nr:SDR family NAD(P)-dependent oxidoreductase [bacterium]
MEIRGRRIIVTGGAKGIGRALAGRLSGLGAVVGVYDIDRASLDSLSEEFENIHCYECDLTDEKQVSETVDRSYREMGGIEILVNNAGAILNSPLVGFSSDGIRMHDVAGWERSIAVNLSSVFYTTVNVVGKMVSDRARGLIVNVSSICASGNAGQCAYSAAKAGVNALTVTWAKELSPFGIRVAGVAPGFTETGSMASSMTEEKIEEWSELTPSGRMAAPEEIADGIVFIIGNDFINGRIIEIDGGLRI